MNDTEAPRRRGRHTSLDRHGSRERVAQTDPRGNEIVALWIVREVAVRVDRIDLEFAST